ncbi:hypothetical protein NN561_004820 [Cricetulus griseus]
MSIYSASFPPFHELKRQPHRPGSLPGPGYGKLWSRGPHNSDNPEHHVTGQRFPTQHSQTCSRMAARERRRCRILDSSAVAGPLWVRPGRPSPAPGRARPGLRLRRPLFHSPGAAAQLPAPTACCRGLVKRPAPPRPVAHRPRATGANPPKRGLGRYLAPRGDGREGTAGPPSTAPTSGCRDGSTKSLADVEGGGETSKDARTDPVRQLREDKPSSFSSYELELRAVLFLSQGWFLQQIEQVFKFSPRVPVLSAVVT